MSNNIIRNREKIRLVQNFFALPVVITLKNNLTFTPFPPPRKELREFSIARTFKVLFRNLD